MKGPHPILALLLRHESYLHNNALKDKIFASGGVILFLELNQ